MERGNSSVTLTIMRLRSVCRRRRYERFALTLYPRANPAAKPEIEIRRSNFHIARNYIFYLCRCETS